MRKKDFEILIERLRERARDKEDIERKVGKRKGGKREKKGERWLLL